MSLTESNLPHIQSAPTPGVVAEGSSTPLKPSPSRRQAPGLREAREAAPRQHSRVEHLRQ